MVIFTRVTSKLSLTCTVICHLGWSKQNDVKVTYFGLKVPLNLAEALVALTTFKHSVTLMKSHINNQQRIYHLILRT